MNETAILSIISQEYQKILGENLVGIYVHGSIAFQCFHWNKSDIDFIVVVRNPLKQSEKVDLISILLNLSFYAPPKGFEMSVVLQEYCKNFVYPTPFELHYSKMHHQKCMEDIEHYCSAMNGVDSDLAAHFTVIRHVGITLYGNNIKQTFGDIPKESFLQSVLLDAAKCKQAISTNPIYYILNLCRIVAYLQDGLVLSKLDGGHWGVKHLNAIYQPLIQKAITGYISAEEIQFEQDLMEQFCDDIFKQIQHAI